MVTMRKNDTSLMRLLLVYGVGMVWAFEGKNNIPVWKQYLLVGPLLFLSIS
jgi:hypothetical protein